jgi:hypothetical protein
MSNDSPSDQDPLHGARDLPGLTVDSYNVELTSEDGFLGDRASHRAFEAILQDWRDRLRRGGGHDPFGTTSTDDIPRDVLDEALTGGAPEAGGLVHAALEDFARELALVIRRFLRLREWQGTERILVGGGFRDSRVGELAVGRAAVLLRAEGIHISLAPIRHDPDHAGLLGAVRLIPPAGLAEADAVLTVDLGGTSFRAGVVLPRLGVARDLSAAGVWRDARWRHANEQPERGEALTRLATMLTDLATAAAQAGLRLAPHLGVGCPGVVAPDGRLMRGAQNMPGGGWDEPGFRLPEELSRRLPMISGQRPGVVLHNDAVVQGLSEAPFQRDALRWGILTIGTGLGNARFTNRAASRAAAPPGPMREPAAER